MYFSEHVARSFKGRCAVHLLILRPSQMWVMLFLFCREHNINTFQSSPCVTAKSVNVMYDCCFCSINNYWVTSGNKCVINLFSHEAPLLCPVEGSCAEKRSWLYIALEYQTWIMQTNLYSLCDLHLKKIMCWRSKKTQPFASIILMYVQLTNCTEIEEPNHLWFI